LPGECAATFTPTKKGAFRLLENIDLVATLEEFAIYIGVEIINGKIIEAERGPQGIAAVLLEDGRRMTADFFIDPTIWDMYNKYLAETWDEIRYFLALHYRFNSKLDTPFWKTCQAEVDVAGAAPLLEFFQENGPLGFARHLLKGHAANFGIDGFLTILVGNKVPYDCRHIASPRQRLKWSA
jgi:hypothetical protein